MNEIAALDWERYGGRLCELDDGHIPENVTSATRIVQYPSLYDRPTQVHVYSNALPETLVDQVYAVTTEDPSRPAWGDYVTMQQIRDYWDSPMDHVPGNDSHAANAVAVAAHYMKLALGEGPNLPDRKYGPIPETAEPTVMWSRKDLEMVHGVALWALAAPVGSQVPYHLDYAEQIRYDSNIIVPPLLAGTLQCTKSPLTGGDFEVSLEGIPHYERHGYKGKKSKDEPTDMLQIRYRYNQLTCHLGDLPHASTRIAAVEDGQSLRVMVGFNVFGHDIGPIVQRAPEHSDAFRRKVKVQRALLQNSKIGNQALSLEAVRHNKPLTKLLVLAKRERIKQEYRQAQERLANEIPQHLPCTVQSLMEYFSNHNEGLCWPASPVDVQVYLHQQIQQGRYHPVSTNETPSVADLVSPLTVISLGQS